MCSLLNELLRQRNIMASLIGKISRLSFGSDKEITSKISQPAMVAPKGDYAHSVDVMEVF